jgi:hypothetical protein
MCDSRDYGTANRTRITGEPAGMRPAAGKTCTQGHQSGTLWAVSRERCRPQGSRPRNRRTPVKRTLRGATTAAPLATTVHIGPQESKTRPYWPDFLLCYLSVARNAVHADAGTLSVNPARLAVSRTMIAPLLLAVSTQDPWAPL